MSMFLDITDENVFEDLPNGKFYANSDALILYTSGTTSKPKGDILLQFIEIASFKTHVLINNNSVHLQELYMGLSNWLFKSHHFILLGDIHAMMSYCIRYHYIMYMGKSIVSLQV